MHKALESLHRKILNSKFAEEVTEQEILALVEVKEVRAKTIDEFCEDIKQYIAYEYGLTDVVLKEIEEIAERLKKEGAV